MEDDILTADPGLELAGQVDPDGLRALEPGLPAAMAAPMSVEPTPVEEGPQGAIGTRVGIRANDEFPRGNQALFRQQRMLHAHLAHIIEVVQIKLPGEGAALEALLGRLDVLIRGEMVHDHGDFVLSNTPVKPSSQIPGWPRGGDVVAQDHVQLGPDQLTGLDLRQAGVGSEDFCVIVIPMGKASSFLWVCQTETGAVSVGFMGGDELLHLVFPVHGGDEGVDRGHGDVAVDTHPPSSGCPPHRR